MDYGLFGVRFLFSGIKREPLLHRRLLIYFATAPFCRLLILLPWGFPAVIEGAQYLTLFLGQRELEFYTKA